MIASFYATGRVAGDGRAASQALMGAWNDAIDPACQFVIEPSRWG
jgi:hypothetical protein